jgi:hypothetical protein
MRIGSGAAGMHLGGRAVAMAATPDGKGYWLASAKVVLSASATPILKVPAPMWT